MRLSASQIVLAESGMLRLLLVIAVVAIKLFSNSEVRADVTLCGEVPPTTNLTLKGDVEGKTQLLSKFLGSAELSGEIEAARTEIFSKYPDPNERLNAYFQYQFCVLLMSNEDMSTREKIEELKQIRREFAKPIRANEKGMYEADPGALISVCFNRHTIIVGLQQDTFTQQITGIVVNSGRHEYVFPGSPFALDKGCRIVSASNFLIASNQTRIRVFTEEMPL